MTTGQVELTKLVGGLTKIIDLTAGELQVSWSVNHSANIVGGVSAYSA